MSDKVYNVLYHCNNCGRDGIAIGIPLEDIYEDEDYKKHIDDDVVIFCYNCSEKCGNEDIIDIHQMTGRIVF